MAKSKHVCPTPRSGTYEWPCPTCFPQYYARKPGVRWYIILSHGCVEPELHGPYKTEHGMEKAARRMKDKGDYGDEESIAWLCQNKLRLEVGAFRGDFFEKQEGSTRYGISV